MMFLLNRLEDIEHARFRALAQLIADKEEGIKAFEKYMQIAFPALALQKRQKDEETKKVLAQWLARGPMRVTPITPPTIRSRMMTRVVKVDTDEKANALYRQLGSLNKPWASQVPRTLSSSVPNAEVRR